MEQTDLFGNTTIKKELISREKLSEILHKRLFGIGLDDLVGLMTNKLDETVEYVALWNGKKTCQKTSLLFNPHRLSTKTKSSKLSILGALANEEFFSGLSRAILFDQYKRILRGDGKDLLYLVIRLGKTDSICH